MRNREVQESFEGHYSSGSEDEYFMNRRGSAGGQIAPSSGAQQAFNANRRRRSAARRRYSDMVSSGDDGDEYDDDVEFGRTTSERQANRECARRIRQKKLDLLNTLTLNYEELQRRNSQLLLDVGAITAQWHQISRENCELQAQLTMAKAIRKVEAKGTGSALEEFNLMTLGDASHANNKNIGIQGMKEVPML